jgi:hypothetical protein
MVYEDQESVEIKFYKYFSQLEIVDLEGSDITHNYNICDVGLSVESGTTGPGEYLLSIGSEFTLSLSPTSGATDVGTFRSIRIYLLLNHQYHL